MQSRVVFMGTPAFAVPSLEALARRVDPEGLLVVTQPDREAGRGRRLQPPPIKAAAELLGLRVEQVATLRDAKIRERLETFAPDLIVVAAFGLLLPKWVLRLPPRGCVNLHASILPRFRGASPIAAAIACGDRRTGVALMQMEAGLDTGAVYDLDTLDIMTGDTTESLTDRLAAVAGGMLAEHLPVLLGGILRAEPQRGKIVETRKITKAHGAIDWARPAEEIERHVRAMWPWPRAWTVGPGDVRLQLHDADVVPGNGGDVGVVLGHDERGILVGTGEGALRLVTVQLPGRTAQPATQLAQHPVFAVGARLEPCDGDIEPWIVQRGETA